MLFKNLSEYEQRVAVINLLTEAYNYYGTNVEAEDLALSAGSLAEDLSSISNLRADELHDLFYHARKKVEVFKCSPFIMYKMISSEKAIENKKNKQQEPINTLSEQEQINLQIDFAESIVKPFVTLMYKKGRAAVDHQYPFIPSSVVYDFLKKHNLSEINLQDNDYNNAIHELEVAAHHAGYYEAKSLKNMIATLSMPQQNRDLSFRAKAYALERYLDNEQALEEILINLNNFITHV